MTTTEEHTRDAPWIGLRDLNLTRFVSLSAALYCSLALANHPLALVKTRLQHAGTTQQSSLAALRALHRGGGVRSLYVAFVPATLGAMPGEFAYIASVEAMRDAVAPQTQRCAFSPATAAILHNSRLLLRPLTLLGFLGRLVLWVILRPRAGACL